MPNKLRQFLHKHRLLCIAVFLVVLRFLLWDIQYLTQLFLPKHDGAHGFAAFAASLHAMRTEGDIAWWNPVHLDGYASYYTGFLAPLAPTYGSVLFILCAQTVRLLALAGVALPEYGLYVLLNSLAAPFLALYFLLRLSSLFFRRAATFWLIGLGYTFTGIGLWNDAWFYWQAPFYLFLLLYGVLGYLKEPSGTRYLILWVSVLLFAAAADFWAVHNLAFILAALAAFCLFSPRGTLGGALRALGGHAKNHRLATALAAACLLAAAVQLGSVFLGQGGAYYRLESQDGFSAWEAFLSGTRYNQYVRFLTVELFRPMVDAAFVSDQLYTIFIHGARYIGAGLLPLLGVAVLQKNRACRMFLCLAVLMLAVCLVPGFGMPVWQALFSSDRAFFFFYAHFWQVALVLLAAAGLEAFLQPQGMDNEKPVLWLLRGGALACAAACAAMAAVNRLSPGVLLLALLAGAGCGLLLLVHSRENAVWLALFLALYAGDVTRYYYACSYQDDAFSTEWFHTAAAVGDARLRGVMTGENDNTFGQRIGELSPPVLSSLWPANRYLVTRYQKDLAAFQQSQPAAYEALFGAPGQEGATPPVRFYAQGPAGGGPAQDAGGSALYYPEGLLAAEYRFSAAGYNHFTIAYTLPGTPQATVLLGQLYDAAWRVTLDKGTPGERALAASRGNILSIAAAVPAGNHTLTMEYHPFARAWYPLFSGGVVLVPAFLIWRALAGAAPSALPRPRRQKAARAPKEN